MVIGKVEGMFYSFLKYFFYISYPILVLYTGKFSSKLRYIVLSEIPIIGMSISCMIGISSSKILYIEEIFLIYNSVNNEF